MGHASDGTGETIGARQQARATKGKRADATDASAPWQARAAAMADRRTQGKAARRVQAQGIWMAGGPQARHRRAAARAALGGPQTIAGGPQAAGGPHKRQKCTCLRKCTLSSKMIGGGLTVIWFHAVQKRAARKRGAPVRSIAFHGKNRVGRNVEQARASDITARESCLFHFRKPCGERLRGHASSSEVR